MSRGPSPARSKAVSTASFASLCSVARSAHGRQVARDAVVETGGGDALDATQTGFVVFLFAKLAEQITAAAAPSLTGQIS